MASSVPLAWWLMTRRRLSSSSLPPTLFQVKTAPIPLGDRDAQRQFEASVREAESNENKRHPDAEKEILTPHPNGINPITGERDGPSGPEPTRFGDWERKGRVTDF